MNEEPELIWSSYQKDIFEDVAEGDHHTVIEALAGSAKTTSIVESIKHIPKNKNALFCAFNKRVVEDLKKKDIPWDVNVSTLHSHGLRAITNAYGRQKVEFKRVGGILGKMFEGRTGNTFELRVRLEKAVSLCKSALALDDQAIDDVLDQFMIDVSNASRRGDPEEDRQAFIDYVKEALNCCKTIKGQIDFDDMVWIPIVNKIPIDRYNRLFVDELQDLSPVQKEIVYKSITKSGRICAVGDENQSIYQWRGAAVDSIKEMVHRLDARVLPLPICYRCPSSVIEVAQEIVPRIQAAPNAIRGTVLEVDELSMLASANPGDVILSRLNAPLLGLCFNFLSAGRKALILGRDIGSSLAAFIRKSNTNTVQELMHYTDEWRMRETARLLNRPEPRKREAEAVDDKANCINVLSQNARTIQDVLATIESLFNDANETNAITLSSVHKFKGLERDTVYMLMRSFRVNRDRWGEEVIDARMQEELNIAYVAITRAKKNLYMVMD